MTYAFAQGGLLTLDNHHKGASLESPQLGTQPPHGYMNGRLKESEYLYVKSNIYKVLLCFLPFFSNIGT